MKRYNKLWTIAWVMAGLGVLTLFTPLRVTPFVLIVCALIVGLEANNSSLILEINSKNGKKY